MDNNRHQLRAKLDRRHTLLNHRLSRLLHCKLIAYRRNEGTDADLVTNTIGNQRLTSTVFCGLQLADQPFTGHLIFSLFYLSSTQFSTLIFILTIINQLQCDN